MELQENRFRMYLQDGNGVNHSLTISTNLPDFDKVIADPNVAKAVEVTYSKMGIEVVACHKVEEFTVEIS